MKALLALSLDSIQNSVVTSGFKLGPDLVRLCFRLIIVAAGWTMILRRIRLEVGRIFNLLESFQRITRIIKVKIAKR